MFTKPGPATSTRATGPPAARSRSASFSAIARGGCRSDFASSIAALHAKSP